MFATLSAGYLLALQGEPSYRVRRQPIAVVVNLRELDERGMMAGNMVMVPMRPIFESLGAEVDYRKASHRVIATKGDRQVELDLRDPGADYRHPNAKPTTARVVGGTTYVPLRFVSETLGATVEWDAATRTASVFLKERKS